MLSRDARAGDGAVGGETRVRPRAGVRGARGLLGCAVAVGAALAAAPSASAITFAHHPITPPPDCKQQKGRWAERTASAGVGTAPDAGADLNADTVNDLWVGQPFCDVGANTDQGRVYLLSGKEFQTNQTSVIRAIDSPAPALKQEFGFFISVIGDSTHDIAIGTDPQPQTLGGTTPPGRAWVFNGDTGALRFELVSPNSQNGDRFGSRIGRAGDVNGDGVPDIIVGASSETVGANVKQGRAYIFSGATGAWLRTLDIPASDALPSSNFGLAVQSPGDVNGDGFPDQLVDAANFTGGLANQGRMYVFSGKDGKLISPIDDPMPQASAYFGFQDVTPLSPGDLNGDGRAEIYGNGFLQTDPQSAQPTSGEAWVFDGASVANGVPVVLRTLHDPTPEPGGQFGWSMSKTDYNHDGVNDLYVGQSPHVAAFPANQNGGTYVFDGKNVVDGTNDALLLKALEMPTACLQPGVPPDDNGPALGWTVSTPGDLNNDGQADYVAGAPFFNRLPNVDEGVLLAFLSNQPENPGAGC